jgi:CxxC-x17-CxxC domain-containing protein
MFEDKNLQCVDCGNEFVWTTGEQEFYAEKGFENEPTRCPSCRKAKKDARRSSREKFEAVCSNCGGVAILPFKPKNDKPVYCSDCFATMKDA